LDLSDTARAPDFITLSFYKIFGFPNLGALLVKKSAWRVMESRKYFGGGTVEMVIAVDDHWVAKKEAAIHSRLEDGTLPFTSIFALDIAIDTHRKLYGPSPMKQISAHTSRLIKKLHDELVALRHSNGKPVIKVYKDPTSIYGNANVQGAMIAFNVQKSNGGFVKFMDVESEANKQDIYLRSGSLCNPGGTASYLQWRPDELREAFEHGHRCSEPIPEYNGKPLGVVRASLGAMSSEDDVDTLVYFLRDTYVDRIYLEDKPLSIPEETVADLAKLTTATVLCVSDGSQTSSFETCTASSDSQSRDSPRDSVLADVRPLPAHTRKRAFRLSVDGLLAVAPNHTKARASHDFPRTNNSVIYERPPSMKTDLSRMRRFKLGVLEVMHIKQGKAMGV
jgi:molybdenum cofactor sulfurtransferase